MRPLKLVLLSVSLTLAFGIGFYFYEPDLSMKTKIFLAAAREPSPREHIERYEVLEQKLEGYEYLGHLEGCNKRIYSAQCLHALGALEPVEIDQNRRANLKEALAMLPILANTSDDLMSFQNLIGELNQEFLQEMRNGGIKQQTIDAHLLESHRIFNEASSILEWMIGTALYGISLSAANLAIATDTEITLPLEQVMVDRLNSDLMRRILAEDLMTTQRSWQRHGSQFEDLNKQSWLLDDARFTWQQHLDFLELAEKDYWTKTLERKRLWFAKWHDVYIFDIDPDYIEFSYVNYFDVAKITQNHAIVLAALSQIYQGADPSDHGVAAPDNWQWRWKEAEMELCLKLSDDFEQTRRVKEAIACLPHIQLQLAAIENRAHAGEFSEFKIEYFH
jgi:hypothetical protein